MRLTKTDTFSIFSFTRNVFSVFCSCICFALVGTLSAQISTVTSVNDDGAGTLRQLVNNANNGDTIVFAESINGDIIYLTTGQINIDLEIVIIGNGADETIIDGSLDVGRDSRIFELTGVGSSLHLFSTTISNAGDTSMSVLQGGAIMSVAELLIESCIIKGNMAMVGGAIYSSGSASSIILSNSSFSRNSVDLQGGAMYNDGELGTNPSSIINCSFSENTATISGGAIFNLGPSETSSILISNSIFWGDTAAGQSNEITNVDALPMISYSIIEGGIPAGTVDGGNNLFVDPLFLDSAIDDLRLQTSSPAINAGNNDSIPSGIDTDLQGSFRIMDSFVDIGAYELTGSECETALRLSCGDTIQGTANYQSDMVEELPDCFFAGTAEYFRSVWHTFLGTGDNITVTLSDYETNAPEIDMYIYRGNCENVICQDATLLYVPSPGSLSLLTEKDTVYHVFFGVYFSAADTIGDYTMSMDCICESDSLWYSSPQNFITGDYHTIKTDNVIEADNLISTGAEIIYDGKLGVNLNSGFEVKAGATFSITSDGCGG